MSDRDEEQRDEMIEEVKERFDLRDDQVIAEPSKAMQRSAYLVCTRARDWDTSMNFYWEEKKNWSRARDLACHKCKEPIVMSNGLYEEYLKNPRPELVTCGECAIKMMEEENS